jgi:hypothetical protein
VYAYECKNIDKLWFLAKHIVLAHEMGPTGLKNLCAKKFAEVLIVIGGVRLEAQELVLCSANFYRVKNYKEVLTDS